MKFFYIDVSVFGDNFVFCQLLVVVVQQWCDQVLDLEVSYCDFDVQLVVYLCSSLLVKIDVVEVVDVEQVLEQFLVVDVVVIGFLMYNFSVVFIFKVWIDCLVVVGCIFKYIENGLVGLVGGKWVIVVSSCGGLYIGVLIDFQDLYLCQVFVFFGIDNVEFVCVEGIVYLLQYCIDVIVGVLVVLLQLQVFVVV